MDAKNKLTFFIVINILLFSILRISLQMSIVMLILGAMNMIMGLTFSVIGTQKNNRNTNHISWYSGLPYFGGFLCFAYYLI